MLFENYVTQSLKWTVNMWNWHCGIQPDTKIKTSCGICHIPTPMLYSQTV
ncbi:hypothetical protein B4U80_04121 [Leptotrombidium deliense]|uniref:Uncharacterized protein n=1 Tax=Leptotrombidium deliense TaxID=299467 RepID=A0A443S2V2_9ACAR|nr:hypothetical protein B4U80_04121 [Leptotrombidium deliense]